MIKNPITSNYDKHIFNHYVCKLNRVFFMMFKFAKVCRIDISYSVHKYKLEQQ